jgi:HrpA-like RNA helicase
LITRVDQDLQPGTRRESMGVVLTNWLQILTAGGALLSGFGLMGTMATVLILVRQTRAVQQASVTAAYQSIISTSSTFSAVLVEHPEIYFAMKDASQSVSHWDFDEQMRVRPQVAIVTTQQLDYFELVLVTMRAFPRPLQAEWQEYIRGILARSPYMQRALLDTDWYTAELRALVEPGG